MLKEEELKEIIGLVFIEGRRVNSSVTTKTKLAKKILSDSKFKGKLTVKSLVNYHRYFFGNNCKFTYPNDNTVDGLLRYINCDSIKNFRENKPTNKDYPDNVPFADYGNDEEEKLNANEVPNIETNKSTSFKYFLFAGLCLVVLVIIFSLSNKKDESFVKNPQHTVTINTKNFIVSDFNKIIPNQNTEFFNKNNEPQVWYASYNNQKEFYNTNGVHPITQKQLEPITKEVIKTILVEKEIIAPKKMPIKTEKEVQHAIDKKGKSLLNTSIINTKNNKEISLFIFDSLNKIDNIFSNRLKEELSNKQYKVTSSLILSSKLNDEIVEHLKSGDLNYFDNKIQNHTDYICIGNVNYSYSQNTIQKNRITCRMQVDYSIISTTTGEIINSYSNLINGNGLSKINAKNNTIKKFSL